MKRLFLPFLFLFLLAGSSFAADGWNDITLSAAAFASAGATGTIPIMFFQSN